MTSKAQGLGPPVWLAVRVVLTVALFAALWQTVDGAEILATLAAASPVWVGAAIGCLLLQTALSAQRWRLTAAALGQTFGASYALREYFLSQAVNQAVPGAVIGDAARAVRARGQMGLLIAGQAVFFERLAGQIAMFAVFLVAFLATDAVAGGVDWPPALRGTLYVCLITAAAALLALLVAQRASAAAWLEPLRRALLTRQVLPQQISLGGAIVLCNLAAFACAARAVWVNLSVIETLALVPVVLFAMLIPFTVSGWGVREGAAAVILPLAGVAAADAVAASIFFGVAILCSVLPGAFVALKS